MDKVSIHTVLKVGDLISYLKYGTRIVRQISRIERQKGLGCHVYFTPCVGLNSDREYEEQFKKYFKQFWPSTMTRQQLVYQKMNNSL